jgi:hypothetical protein
MISRIVLVAALAVGTFGLMAPADAQTGVSNSPDMGNSRAMNAQAALNGEGTMGQGSMGQGSGRQGMRGDAGERRMTECLNNAAAQHQSMDSCRH